MWGAVSTRTLGHALLTVVELVAIYTSDLETISFEGMHSTHVGTHPESRELVVARLTFTAFPAVWTLIRAHETSIELIVFFEPTAA